MSTASTQAPKTPRRLQTFSGDDALDPQPPIDWIVENVFSSGSVSIVAGEGGAGKSFAMLDCGVAIASGAQWLDFATKKNAVLLVDEESGSRRLKQRLGDTMRAHQVTRGHVKISCVSLAGLNLMQSFEQTSLLNAIKDTAARFVVIDALIDTLIGGDENSSADMQTVFRGLRHIADATNAALVTIHHLNRNGGYRGSSAIRGAVDLLLLAERAGDTLNFRSEKSRDSEPFAFSARMNFAPGSFNLSPTATKPSTRNPSQQYVLDFLAKVGSASLADIENGAVGCTGNAARQSVYQLCKAGLVTRIGGGGRGSVATYAVVI